MKTVAYLGALLPTLCWALVPVAGGLMGEARPGIQDDPLAYVFQAPLTQTSEQGEKLYRRYLKHVDDAQALKLSCEHFGEASYANDEQKRRAYRSVVGTLQYIGLDLTVKAIGQFAKQLQMSENEFLSLAKNLTISSCSPNLSVYGVKFIEQNLLQAFRRDDLRLPEFPGMPYVAERLVVKNKTVTSKELELHYTIQNFRALCSWGGDTENYRLLPPLLSNPLVMISVLKHLENKATRWDTEKGQLVETEGQGTVQVLCQGLICRKTSPQMFNREFPRLVGTSGLRQDLYRMWCDHFQQQRFKDDERQHPRVREWLKELGPDQERLMVGQMVALLTEVPDLVVSAKSYGELAEDIRAGIDERWDKWAKRTLSLFSRNIYYEESLQLKVNPRRDPLKIRQELFKVDMSITMGELDRLLDSKDKLKLSFSLKLPRNWLRWLRLEWNVVNQKASPEAMEAFTEKVADYLNLQLQEKRKYFPTPLFDRGIDQLIAQELIEQVLLYQGPLFDSYEDYIVNIPVQFQYGTFALSYMRYKADIKLRHVHLDL